MHAVSVTRALQRKPKPRKETPAVSIRRHSANMTRRLRDSRVSLAGGSFFSATLFADPIRRDTKMPPVEIYSVHFKHGNLHPHWNPNGWDDMRVGETNATDYPE